jgi:hypothetical protein
MHMADFVDVTADLDGQLRAHNRRVAGTGQRLETWSIEFANNVEHFSGGVHEHADVVDPGVDERSSFAQ